MTLNGWRRLWVVCSALWILWMAWQTTVTWGAGTLSETLAFVSLWTVGPPVIVYLTGLVAAWVAAGFRQRQTGPLAPTDTSASSITGSNGP